MTFAEANIGGDHSIVYDLAPYDADAWFSWGAFDGENAIIAKAGLNDGTNDGLDASGYDYLHIDVMSANAAPYAEIQIMDIKVGDLPLTGSGWQSFDLPLAAYKTAHPDKISDINHMKFAGFRGPNNPEEVAIDNVYFWSPGVTTSAEMNDKPETGGWASFASASKVSVPDGVKVYKATYQKTSTEEILNLTEIGNVIPANAGVIIRGAANNTYAFQVTSADGPDMSDNVLVGCPVRTDVSGFADTKDIFCLRYSEMFEMTGFFLYTGQYIPAGKAYLALDKVTSGPNNVQRKVRFVFNEEQVATGVENVGTDAAEVTKFIENGQLYIRRGDAVYTIQGSRVQ